MNNKKLIAEAFGTFVLTSTAMFSILGSFAVPTPVLVGLTLMLFVYTIGSLSGAHLNPAVTVGLWSLGKIKMNEATSYIISQFVGAVFALLLVKYIKVPVQGVSVDTLEIGFAEIIGTAVFTFGIAAVATGKVREGLSGFVIGGSLIIGISTASLFGSPGILNPAVALGLESASIMTVLGPLLGSLVGMQFYKFLHGKVKSEK